MLKKTALDTVRTVADLRARISAWRANGESVGLVPTMGALHEGHLSLVRRSQAMVSRTVVSVFVNPKQFAPTEDFSVYPRDEAGDAVKLAAQGADLLFAPNVEQMYPAGSVTQISVPGIGDILEGEFRPGFFTGVATIVTKLLLQSLPDIAVFGEKDYQQLQVIKRMTADLDIPVRIEGAPTVREENGLAKSSRNTYLSPEEQGIAPFLFRVLNKVALRVASGYPVLDTERQGREELLAAGFNKVDYLGVRHAQDLSPVDIFAPPLRVLAAAWLGRTRLIDNIEIDDTKTSTAVGK